MRQIKFLGFLVHPARLVFFAFLVQIDATEVKEFNHVPSDKMMF
jgi:hypothetical protein